MSENDKIMLFQPRQLPFLSVRASCKTGCKRTVLRRMSGTKLSILNPLDYHIWGAVLEKYHKLQPKPTTIDELKVMLQTMLEELPQEHINKAVANFTKCLTAYMAVAATGGQFEQLQ